MLVGIRSQLYAPQETFVSRTYVLTSFLVGYFAESWKEQYWYMGGMVALPFQKFSERNTNLERRERLQ